VIQFWEEMTESIPTMEHPAAGMYQMLVTRFRERAFPPGRMPIGMPETLENMSVRAYRDGKAGYILFEPEDSLAEDLKAMPVRVKIEYDYGYAKFGMGDRYTLRMLAQEFWALTQNSWELYPGVSVSREIDGTIRRGTTTDAIRFNNSLSSDVMVDPPVRIQEDQGRGTAINSKEDQARLLQYWAWARQEIAAGVAFFIDNHTTEYWMNLVLDPLEEEDEGRAYAGALQQLCHWRLRQLSLQIAAACDAVQDYSYKMRYQGNALKVWFIPTAHLVGG
jgi:hypothetical protein